MKIVAVPDIHQAPNLDQVEKVVRSENADLTVFLGDYFDQIFDDPGDAGRTAEWLANSLKQPNRIHLFGNHDLPYRFPYNLTVQCPGWTAEKHAEVERFMSESEWAKLKLLHWEGDWLFTHAGWSKQLWKRPNRPHYPGTMSLIGKKLFLDDQVRLAWEAVGKQTKTWVFGRGQLRGGNDKIGGLTWCDAHEFKSIPGVNQVFGHTPGKIRNLSKGPEQAWVIDTTTRAGVQNCLVIVDGVVSSRDVPCERLESRPPNIDIPKTSEELAVLWPNLPQVPAEEAVRFERDLKAARAAIKPFRLWR